MANPKVEKAEGQWNFDFGDTVIAVSFEQASKESDALKIAERDYKNSKATVDAANEAKE